MRGIEIPHLSFSTCDAQPPVERVNTSFPLFFHRALSALGAGRTVDSRISVASSGSDWEIYEFLRATFHGFDKRFDGVSLILLSATCSPDIDISFSKRERRKKYPRKHRNQFGNIYLEYNFFTIDLSSLLYCNLIPSNR